MAALRRLGEGYPAGTLEFHAIQTRESGRQRFVSMHVLVPGEWTVTEGHDLVERVENDVRAVLHDARVHTHLEPREDPRSYEDIDGGFSLFTDG